MKKIYFWLILSFLIFCVGQVKSQSTDLLISEYGEGSSANSKYIEIYNGTGSSIDLTNYRIRTGVNGAGLTAVITLSTILPNGGTYVIANNNTDVPGANLISGFATWNGDDAIALERNISSIWTLIDVIGTIGIDPGTGWAVAGVANGTVDKRLTRKSTVCSPNTNWSLSAGTNSTDSEWILTIPYTTGSANAGHTASCVSCTAPTTQASLLSFSNITPNTQDLNFTRGNGTGGVLVIGKSGSAATDPSSGTSYTGNTNFGSGTAVGTGVAVFNGTTSPQTITNLTAETRYFYNFYEWNTTGTCYNLTELTGNAWTLSNEPTTHAATFTATPVSSTQINLAFSAASTITNADGYIILIRSDNTVPTTTGVVDGVASGSWSLPAGTTVLTNINSTATTTFSNTGLTATTDYCYLLIPYNWDATNASTYNYRTAVTVANVCASTLAPAPEMNLKQGVTNYTTTTTPAGSSTYAFSATAWGVNNDVTFTVENLGNATLTLSAPVVTGTGFSLLTGIGSTSVAGPSGTTTFVVRFTPNAVGAFAGTISIGNNDSDENPYVINITGTGLLNNTSNIIRNAGFTEASNIAYSTYQATNITGTGVTDIKIGEFTIQDGGNSLIDADNQGTTLTAISFSVNNFANIRRIALYDGITEVGTEQAGAATVSFTGLSLAAVDNASKTFSVYASFNTAVTDNQQVQLTISNATANPSGSTFAATNADGASTSVVTDANRIEVVATRLVFTQGPTSTAVLTNMSPAVIVSARDAIAFNNIDLDYTSLVTLSLTTTTCGSLIGNTANAIGGLATFASLQGTVAEAGLTLTAISGALPNIISTGTFDFTSASAVVTTLVNWNFTDGNGVADGGIAANNTKTVSTVGGTSAVSFVNCGGCVGENGLGARANNWNSGNGTKYWLTDVVTTGYSNITVSSRSRSSNTGPRNFSLEYRIPPSATWITIVPIPQLTNDGYNVGVLSNQILPVACQNQPQVFLRWIMTSNTDVQGNTVAASGASNIDDIIIQGTNLSAAAGLYYQSKGTGNFESPCSWETSASGSAPWTQASASPDFSAQTITILNGQTITINQDVTIDQLVVNNGGTLVVNNNVVTWNNGTGTDLLINGTYIDNATSANSSIFSTGATWSLGTIGSPGNFIKTRNSSATIFRDNYEGGLSNIPANANWILRYTGASDVSFTTVAGSTGSFPSASIYPNLIFENASISPTYTFISKFTGASNTATIKGNLDIGGTTYTNAVVVTNDNTNATPLQINGALNIRAGSTLTNVGAPGGTGFDIKGNLLVEGTFINNSSTNQIGNLVFSGTGSQTISGTGTMNLEDVNINNSGAGIVTVNKDFDIPGTLNFGTDAELNLASGNITLKTTSTRTANVGIIPTTAVIAYSTGKFIVERHIKSGRKWRYLSVPTNSNQTFKTSWQEGGTTIIPNPAPGYGMIIGDPRPNAELLGFDRITVDATVKTYDGGSQLWTGIDNTNAFIPARTQAYMAFVPGNRLYSTAASGTSETILRTSGQLYRGNIPDITIPNGQFVGIGNPYASPINMVSLLDPAVMNNGIAKVYYVWDPQASNGASNVGRFQTLFWNDVDGYQVVTGDPTSSYPDENALYNSLESGQAFLVRGEGSGGVVQFTELDKTLVAPSVNFTSGIAQQLNVKLKNVPVNTSPAVVLDGFRLFVDQQFRVAVDNNDILKIKNNFENIGILQQDSILVVERRPLNGTSDTIHISSRSLRLQNYQWDIKASNMDYPGRTGFFVDRFTNTSTALQMEGSTTVNFSVQNTPGSYATNRFYIVFRQEAAGPLPVTFTTVTATRNADKTISVQWKVEQEINITKYEVERSSNGSLFTSIQSRSASLNNGGAATYDHIDGAPYAFDNFYRIKATSIGGQVQYSEIVKVGSSNNKPTITVYPNPVKDKTLQVRFEQQGSGRYQLQLLATNGQTVFVKELLLNNINQMQTLAIPKQLSAGNYQLKIQKPDGSVETIKLWIE